MTLRTIETWRFKNEKGNDCIGIQKGAKGFRLEHLAGYNYRRNHNGWYSDAYQDNTYAGAYWLLSTKDDRHRALLGYYDKNAECYIFEVKEYVSFEITEDSLADILRRADNIARIEAESAVEADIAYLAQEQLRQEKEDLSHLRKGLIALCKELRKVRIEACEHPAIKEALQNSVRDLIERRNKHFAKIRRLEADPSSLIY